MKKLYTLALAALVCASASALDRANMKSLRGEMPLKTTVASTKVAGESQEMDKAPAKASIAESDILGEYLWTFYGYLESQSGNKRGVVEITKATDSDSLNVSLLGWDVKATYDATTGKLTIPSKQFLEYNEYNRINVFFYHNRWSADGKSNSFLDTPLVGTFDGKTISFDDNDNIVVGLEEVGYFIFAGSNKMTKKVQLDMTTGWTAVGTGTFYDGWVLSGMELTLEQVEAEFGVADVTLERNADGLYRLNNPYQVPGCVFYEYGLQESTTPGYVVFDVSDPEFVTVYPNIYAGMTMTLGSGASASQTMFYNSNIEAYFTITNGMSKEEAIEYGELEDVSNYDSATGTVTFYNCCYGDQEDPETPYTWVDQSHNAITMTGKFVSEALKAGAGVSNVTVDDSNAPVEYFNLQGVRVANPENGLYIRRQGNTATKVLVK